MRCTHTSWHHVRHLAVREKRTRRRFLRASVSSAEGRPTPEEPDEKSVSTRGWSSGTSGSKDAREDVSASLTGGMVAFLVLIFVGAGSAVATRAVKSQVQKNATRSSPMQTLSLQVQETDQGEVQSPIDHAEYTTDESVQNELEGYQEMDGHYEDELDPDDMRALSAEMDHGEKEDELGEYNGTVVRVDLSDAQVILAQTIEAAARANASASETVRIAGLAAEAAVDAARVASKLQAAINGATVNTIEEAVSIAETAAKKAEEAEKRAHGAAQMAKKAVEEARIQTSAARNVQVNGRSVEGADSGPTQVPWVSLGAEKWTTGLKTFHARVGEKLIGAIKTAKVRLWMMLPSSAVE